MLKRIKQAWTWFKRLVRRHPLVATFVVATVAMASAPQLMVMLSVSMLTGVSVILTSALLVIIFNGVTSEPMAVVEETEVAPEPVAV